MKEKLNLIILLIILGLGIWIIDIFIHSYVFPEESFLDSFIMHMSDPSLYFRLILFTTFFSIVLFVSKKINDNKIKKEVLQEYLILIGTAIDAIIVADYDTGIILNANSKAEELLGIPVKMIKGMHQSELHPSEEADRYRHILKEYIKAHRGNEWVKYPVLYCNLL